jgi:phosphoribosylcarboxyaminoimidazole (NCAIR) mutase
MPLVGVVMGSASDWETLRHACDTLDDDAALRERWAAYRLSQTEQARNPVLP